MKKFKNAVLTLFLALVVQLSYAQQKDVSGTITDEDGMPLIGVNIIIKETNNGTQTDFDGKYSLESKVGDIITYSYLGYETVTKTVASNPIISFSMKNSAEEIPEVIITALGIKRKQDELTTANKVVKAEVLTQAESPDVVSSLTGKVSGLQISQTDGGANPTNKIVLRGIRSLTGNNEALVVIDGAISSSTYLQALDPKLIESVNVIKGANGAALYGAQGGNGVIIVTTKKGAKDKDKFTLNVNSSVQLQNIAFLPERQSTYGQGWNGLHYSYENGAWGPAFNNSMLPVGLPKEDGTYNYFKYKGNPNNIKDFFKQGTTTQNSVSLSSGSAEAGFVNLFAGIQKTGFIVKGDDFKRNTFSFKGGKKLGKFNVSGNATYITSIENGTYGVVTPTLLSSGNYQVGSSLYAMLLQTPTNVILNAYDGSNEGHWNGYYFSPTWVRDNSRFIERADRLNATAEIGYEINKNIDVVYRGNVRFEQKNEIANVKSYTDPDYISSISGFTRTAQSFYGTSNFNRRNIYSDLLLNLNYDLTKDISFKANFGNNITERMTKSLKARGFNLTVEDFNNTSNISTTPNLRDRRFLSRTVGLFANLDFGYKDFLFLNLTGRNDWTSVLDKENRSFFYPSAGISFIPTKLIEKNDILNYAKLSYSIVKVGTADVDPYEINSIYKQAVGFPFGGLNSFIQSLSSADPLLQNQFINSNEFNLNLGFLNDRITLDGSYYTSKNTNQILGTDPSYTSGLSQATINIGATKTQGFEIDLGITPIKSKKEDGLKWSLNTNFSKSKTIVEKVTDQSNRVSIASSSELGFFAIEGEEFPIIMGTGYSRDSQGRVIIDKNTGNPLKSGEFIKLGKTTPDYIIGLNTSVDFKNFTLSAVMDYRTGHQFFSAVKKELARSGYLKESIESGRRGFIFPNSVIETSPGVYTENTTVPTGGTTYTDYVTYYTEEYHSNPENFVLDATAFKLREVALSYNMPDKFLSGMPIKSLKIGVNARNPLAIFAKENQGFADPETSTRNDNGGGFAGLGQYPPTKFYGLSLNLTL